MILGNESKLLDFLHTVDTPHYERDSTLALKLNVSVSSLKTYRKKLKAQGLIECKSLFKGDTKVTAYHLRGERK